jgi:hypothetical protein
LLLVGFEMPGDTSFEARPLQRVGAEPTRR